MAKILVADDASYMRALMTRILEEFEDKGHTILTARNGQEAIDLIKKEVPDIVFLDVVMPIKEGYEVCREVKSSEELKDIYVIILTSNSSGYDKKMVEEVGADYYMTKPFDPDMVLEVTRGVLALAEVSKISKKAEYMEKTGKEYHKL